MGIKVIGMGPGEGRTGSTAAALDAQHLSLGTRPADGGRRSRHRRAARSQHFHSDSQLAAAIVSSVSTVAAQPVNISLSADSLPAGLTFTPSPGTATAVGPGGTATFNVTLNVGSIPYTAAFNANFVDAATGAVLGTIPFQIDLPAAVQPSPPGTPSPSSPPDAPSPVDPPSVADGNRLGRHFQPTTIYISYTAPMNPDSAQYVNNYVYAGTPSGRTVAIASATYDSSTDTVTLKPKRE